MQLLDPLEQSGSSRYSEGQVPYPVPYRDCNSPSGIGTAASGRIRYVGLISFGTPRYGMPDGHTVTGL